MTSFLFITFLLKLVVVFLFLFYFILCVQVCARTNLETEPAGKELFVLNEKLINVKKCDGAKDSVHSEGITFKNINLPVLLAINKEGVMVAVGEANYTEKDDVVGKEKIDVVAKFVVAGESNKWGEDVVSDIKGKWQTQLATKNENEEKLFSTIRAATVNEETKNIYLFLINIPDNNKNIDEWKLKLVSGTISSTEENEKKINWQTEELSFLDKVTEGKEKINNKKINWDPNGHAFMAKDKTIVCVVNGYLETEKKYVTVFFQFQNNNKQNNLKLLYVDITTTLYSSFFQWEGEIFGAQINDQNNGGKVVVFDHNKEEKLKKNDSPIVRLQDFLKDKNNFTTTTINGVNVLLSIQLKTITDGSEAHLWITDGTHVSDVGTIFSKKFKGKLYSSVLFTNNQLFALYQIFTAEQDGKESNNNNKIYIIQLDQQLKAITTILDVWKKNNDTIKELCDNIKSTAILCNTDGLVSFLSVTDDENNWHDKYLNANPTLSTKNNGEMKKKENGFMFSGEGAGAQWVLDKLTKELKYNFIDPGFTLVATVTIDEINNELGNSLLGVSFSEKTKSFGLFCSKENKWTVSFEKDSSLKNSDKECEKGRMYSVALVFNEIDKLKIFVDWEELIDLKDDKIEIEKSDKITHFYFGANNENQKLKHSDVTITNVLLYNRPFKTSEITELKTKQKDKVLPKPNSGGVDTQEGTSEQNNNLNKFNKNTNEIDGSLDTLDMPTINTERNKENEENISLRPESSGVHVDNSVVVFYVFLGFWTFFVLFIWR